MVVVSQTDGITVPANTTIVSIDEVNSLAVLSAAPNLGTGSVTFQATGPSNTSADGGGIRVKGTTDKTFVWDNTNTSWTSNQNLNLNAGLSFRINGTSVLNSTTLGANVVNSSLTSLGTLTSLAIANSGTAVGLTITNTGTGDCFVVNDEASDTTPFKIDNAGTLYITGNISDGNASTGTTNQVIARKAGGGIEWKGINSLADPNTVTNAGTSTDNAIARFDLATGKVIQNSGVTIDDSGNIRLSAMLNAGTNTFTKGITSQTGEIVLDNGTTDTPGIHFYYGNNTNCGIDYNATSGLRIVRNLDESGGTVLASFDPTSTNFRIETGNIVIGTSGKGIDFSANANAAGMTSELLDDYEVGTFTPILAGLTTTGTGTYTSQVGRYTKVGNRVYYNLYISWSAHTGTGAMVAGGLPFTSNATAQNFHTASFWPNNIPTNTNDVLIGYIAPGQTSVRIESYPLGGGPVSSVDITGITDAAIMISGHYEV